MGWLRGIAARGLAALLATVLLGAAALAQPVPDAPPPVLTLDQEELYLRSQWGQRVQASLEQRGREIAAENDRLADQFAAEEQELTALRQTLPPDEFRKRADEFDKRVVQVRRDRDAAARALQVEADEERKAFFRAVRPVLDALMRERGAVVVLDQRAILASQSIDVTDALIERMDREIGAGPLAEPSQQDPPAGEARGAQDPLGTAAEPGSPPRPLLEGMGETGEADAVQEMPDPVMPGPQPATPEGAGPAN